MLWFVGSLVVAFAGFRAVRADKRGVIAAMQADGFTSAQIARAMRHYNRGDKTKMASYCREVIERKAAAADLPSVPDKRDWTRADAYVEEVA